MSKIKPAWYFRKLPCFVARNALHQKEAVRASENSNAGSLRCSENLAVQDVGVFWNLAETLLSKLQ